jgi:hypothetical protein
VWFKIDIIVVVLNSTRTYTCIELAYTVVDTIPEHGNLDSGGIYFFFIEFNNELSAIYLILNWFVSSFSTLPQLQ